MNEIKIIGTKIYTEEYIEEENLYFNPNESKYIIAIDDSFKNTFQLMKEPYIKVYKGRSYKAADSVFRLKLTDGTLTEHRDGKDTLSMNSKIRKFLRETFVKPTTYRLYAGLNVYDACWKFLEDIFKDRKIELTDKRLSLDELLKRL